METLLLVSECPLSAADPSDPQGCHGRKRLFSVHHGDGPRQRAPGAGRHKESDSGSDRHAAAHPHQSVHSFGQLAEQASGYLTQSSCTVASSEIQQPAGQTYSSVQRKQRGGFAAAHPAASSSSNPSSVPIPWHHVPSRDTQAAGSPHCTATTAAPNNGRSLLSPVLQAALRNPSLVLTGGVRTAAQAQAQAQAEALAQAQGQSQRLSQAHTQQPQPQATRVSSCLAAPLERVNRDSQDAAGVSSAAAAAEKWNSQNGRRLPSSKRLTASHHPIDSGGCQMAEESVGGAEGQAEGQSCLRCGRLLRAHGVRVDLAILWLGERTGVVAYRFPLCVL